MKEKPQKHATAKKEPEAKGTKRKQQDVVDTSAAERMKTLFHKNKQTGKD